MLVTFDENSRIIRVKLLDSTSTVGAGKTGLAYNTSGLIISTIADVEATPTVYTQAATHIETITTLGTYAAPSASCCRFKEVDATNHPGLYEIHLPDARYSVASAKSMIISVHGATGLVQCDALVELPRFDVQTAKQAVSLAAADVSGNVPAAVNSIANDAITAASIAANAITSSEAPALANLDAAVTTRLAPTVAGRTLDVTTGGEAGIDWANIGSPTTAVNLSGTNIDVDQVVASVSGAVGSVTGAVASVTGNVGGNVVGSVGSVTGNVGGNVAGSVASVSGAVGSVTSPVTAGTVSDKTGYALSTAGIQAIWDALSSALTTVGSIGKRVVDYLDAAVSSRLSSAGYTAPPSAASNADAIWDEVLADHLTAGTTGNALNAAGSAGDPWSTALPGAYGSGSAGKIIGDNLNATVGSRSTQTSVDTIAGYIDTEVAAIKAKTDNLPASPAAVGSAMTLTADYDAAKTAATQTSVNDVPTNAELASALAGADDAVLAAIAGLSIPTAAQNAAALMDLSNGVETGLTPRQALRLLAAAAAGELSGAATTTIVIRNAVADSKDRITATVDADGNRSAVTVDLT